MLYAATWLSSGSCSGLVLAGLIACHLPVCGKDAGEIRGGGSRDRRGGAEGLPGHHPRVRRELWVRGVPSCLASSTAVSTGENGPGGLNILIGGDLAGESRSGLTAVGRLTILRAAFRRLSHQDAPRLKSSPPYCLR